jgi:hypothetical protein
MMDLIWTIVLVVLILWVLGLVTGIGGSIIHILLIIAVIVIVYRLLQGRNILTGK